MAISTRSAPRAGLEREAERNLELIWLLKGLTPGYRTIAKFRQENWAALKAANREFVLMARELDLVGGELVAIDGAFFHGNASKASIATQQEAHQAACGARARTLRPMATRWRRTTRRGGASAGGAGWRAATAAGTSRRRWRR